MIYLDLIFNLCLLVALSVVSGFIERHRASRIRLGELLQGALFGGVAVLGMLRPLDLGAGLIFDGRSIMISLCALFFGPVAAALTVAVTLLVRIGLGGTGVVMGVLVILSSAGIGLLARSRLRPETVPPSARQLFLFGLVVHAAMVALMTTLPESVRMTVLRRIGPAVLLMYPLATILAGKILSDQVTAARMVSTLRQAEERFRTFFDTAPIGKSIASPDGKFLRVNPAFAAMLGYTTEEMEKIDFAAVTHPGDLEESRARLASLIAGECAALEMEKRLACRDGRRVWVQETTFLQRDAEGRPLYLSTHAQDITERKKAEDALRESESRYRTIFDRVTDGVLIIDPEKAAPLVFNDQACGQLGYTREEFGRLSLPDIEAVEDGEETRARIRKILETGYDEFETLHRTKDGRLRNVYVKVQLVRDGEKPLFHSIWRDITESKQAEEEKEKLRRQLQTAQKMEAVGTLAGGIAHDFNNALTGIFGFGSLLRDRLSGNVQAERDLDDILSCAERAATLTRQLLTFARRQVIEPVNLDLNALVAALLNLIGRVSGEHIGIVSNLEEGLPTVYADRGQIEQALMNLCLNARDAMPGGGKLIIRTGSVELDEEYIARHPYMRAGKYAVLEVSDTGAGMDESIRERVFDPFFTTKDPDKGTGLGLAVVYGTVKRHNGFIHLYSEPGKGTSFKLYFPAVDAAPDAVPEKRAEEPLLGGTETILLADDEEPIRAVTERILKDLGYDVLSARNGEEAVELFRRVGKVDLVVLDMVMPAMGGREAFVEMRKRDPRLRAIFMSGYSGDAVHEPFAATSGQPFLQKPFAPSALARKVRELLDAEDVTHAG